MRLRFPTQETTAAHSVVLSQNRSLLAEDTKTMYSYVQLETTYIQNIPEKDDVSNDMAKQKEIEA